MRVNIVGGKFRPPAEGVLKALPSGARIVLRADPGNEYDDKAIRVLIDLRNFVEDGGDFPALTASVEPYGWDAMELVSYEAPMWLGYLAKSGAKTTGGGPGNGEVADALGATLVDGAEATLMFDGNGWPQAEVFVGADAADGEWASQRPINDG